MPSGPLLDFAFSPLIERITSPSPIEMVSKMQSRAMVGQVGVVPLSGTLTDEKYLLKAFALSRLSDNISPVF